MTRIAVVVASLVLAAPLGAQNPFKLPHASLTAVAVDYSYTGDMQGTGQRSMSRDRVAEHRTTTGKFFGKTTTMDTWTLTTPDSSYTVDLAKKTGTRMPNLLPHLASAYDGLDAAGKTRLRQNMQDMSQMISRAFGTAALNGGAKTGTKTYAGQRCDERTFGTFSICSMQGAAGIPLHMSGSMLCVNFEETATAVRKGEPPAASFEAPAGINFREGLTGVDADSIARGYVGYLASQQLSDSIAKAKTELAARPASTGGAQEMTPEQQAQAKKSCEALKNFNLGKAMNDAAKHVVGDAVREAAQERKAEVEEGAKNKIKNALRRPHL